MVPFYKKLRVVKEVLNYIIKGKVKLYFGCSCLLHLSVWLPNLYVKEGN